MARRGFQLKNHLRYMQPQHAGELRYEYLPDDPVFGRTRTGLSWLHAQNFAPGLSGQVDYNKVSDDRYFVDLASQVKQVSVGNLPQDAFVTKYGTLGSGNYTAQARVQRFQTLQDPLAPIVPPYHRVPHPHASARHNAPAGRLRTPLPGHYARGFQLPAALHREPLHRRRPLRRWQSGDARADHALPPGERSGAVPRHARAALLLPRGARRPGPGLDAAPGERIRRADFRG